MKALQKRIQQLLAEGGPVTIGIDGRCAAGKTTLATQLADQFSATVIPMDDFFLQPAQRTPQRTALPGGNVDFERFYAQVAVHLGSGNSIEYPPFRCTTMDFLPMRKLEPTQLTIVEGAYTLRPELAECYQIKVFLDIAPELQRKRLTKRNPAAIGDFLTWWIPLEEAYFSHHRPQKTCNFIYHATDTPIGFL